MVFVLLMFFSTACTPAQTKLAEFTENDVHVSIQLEKTEAGGYLLSATFTPPEGYHLYSKDLPRSGVDGLGRPTLLELPGNATPATCPAELRGVRGRCREMQPAGQLRESVASVIPSFEPKDLRVYPAGPVTLSLPVTLPEAAEPFEDTISVTYMACNNTGCKPPVIGELVPVKISIK